MCWKTGDRFCHAPLLPRFTPFSLLPLTFLPPLPKLPLLAHDLPSLPCYLLQCSLSGLLHLAVAHHVQWCCCIYSSATQVPLLQTDNRCGLFLWHYVFMAQSPLHPINVVPNWQSLCPSPLNESLQQNIVWLLRRVQPAMEENLIVLLCTSCHGGIGKKEEHGYHIHAPEPFSCFQ